MKKTTKKKTLPCKLGKTGKVHKILTEDMWVSGYFAQNAHGLTVQPESEEAEKFCSVGLVRRFYTKAEVTEKLKALANAITGRTYKTRQGAEGAIIKWNDDDDRSYPQVHAAFKKGNV